MNASLAEAKCVCPFPPSAFTDFYGTMMASDFLTYIETSCGSCTTWFCLPSSGYVRISAVPITHLRESPSTSAPASPCSQTGGRPTVLAFCDQPNVVCCHQKNIDQIPLYNYFPAPSLRLRYGSAVPCPTLRTNVTTSPPRTRYGRMANPYPTGLSCCEIISLQRSLAQPVENRINLFSQLALW